MTAISTIYLIGGTDLFHFDGIDTFIIGCWNMGCKWEREPQRRKTVLYEENQWNIYTYMCLYKCVIYYVYILYKYYIYFRYVHINMFLTNVKTQ